MAVTAAADRPKAASYAASMTATISHWVDGKRWEGTSTRTARGPTTGYPIAA